MKIYTLRDEETKVIIIEHHSNTQVEVKTVSGHDPSKDNPSYMGTYTVQAHHILNYL